MDYELDGNVLRVVGSLSEVLDTEFDNQVSRLLEVEEGEIVMDFSSVPTMSSWYLGKLADVAMEAYKKDKKLKIVASPAVEKVIRLVGLERLFCVELKGTE